MKSEEIKKYEDYIKDTQATLDNLKELREKLNGYDKKIIDKRFFIEFFTVSNEYREWTKYSISKPRYDWSKHTNELYIDRNCTLELNGRDKQHILAVIEAEGAKRENWLKGYQEELAKLEGLDEQAIIDDILAVFEKHGKPKQWQKILDIYEVKYPKENNE